MKRFNYRLLFILLGISACCAIGLFFVHRLQSGRIAKALLWQARRCQDEGHLKEAAQYLGRYLEFSPDDVEERANLGRILASDMLASNPKFIGQAYFVLGQVLAREPQRDDVRRLLVDVSMKLQRYDLASKDLDVLLKTSPDNGELENLLGQCHESQGDRAEAAGWFRKAIQHAPHQVDAYVNLAHLLRRSSDPAKQSEQDKEADQVIQDLVVNNDQVFQAHLARWRYLKEAGPLRNPDQVQEAAKDVDRAFQLAPTEADVLLAAAELAQTRGNPDQARQHLDKGLELYPQNLGMYQARARLEIKANNRPQAVTWLRQGAKLLSGPDQVALLWTLANLLIDGGDVSSASEVMTQLRQGNPSPAAMDFLEARLLIHDGHWPQAAQILEQTRPQLDDAPDLLTQTDLLLGQCYEQLDEPARQLAAYSNTVGRDPSSVTARLGMANAQLALGRIDDALVQYQQLVQLPNAPATGWTEIARLLILRNRQGDKRDWKAVDEALRRAEEVPSQADQVALLRVEMLVAQNQLQPAREILEKGRDSRPRQTEFSAALASLAVRQGKTDEARTLLEKLEHQQGDTVDQRLAWARFWTNSRSTEAGAALQKLTQGVEKFSPDDQSRLLSELGDVLYRSGRVKEAGSLWRRLAGNPNYVNNLRIRFLLLNLAIQTNDEQLVQSVLGDLERIEGEKGTLWRYGEAMRLIWEARNGKMNLLDEAQPLLDAVAVQRPDWPAVLEAKAEIDDLKGNSDQAIVNYRQAISLGERNPQASHRLIQLLCQCRRYAEADQELRNLQAQGPISSGLEQLAVTISLNNQDPSRAVSLARQAMAADSKDYRDYLWLGQVLAASGQHAEEAQQELRRAVDLAPQEPETWMSLIQFLADVGRQQEAEVALQEAQTKLPADRAPLVLGQCYEAIGQVDRAGEFYRAALSAKPDDPVALRRIAGFYSRVGRLADAESSLRKLMSLNDKVPDNDLGWARRTLAMVVAEQGDYRQLPESLELVGLKMDSDGNPIEGNTPSGADAVEQLRARARVLATQNRRSFHSAAIASLAELRNRKELAGGDQLLLAQLYEADDAWPKARDQFLELVTSHDNEPIFLSQYIKSLLRHGETDEAELYINKLEEIEKIRRMETGTLETVDLKAQMLMARGEGEKAIALLKTQVESKTARPAEIISLAGLLASRQRLQEALDLCDRAWKTCPPEAVSATSVGLLQSSQPTREQFAQVEGALKAAIRANPNSVTLQIHLAVLEDLQGHFPEAKALYRAILDKDNRQVAALNNLAWLLTYRSNNPSEALPLIHRAIEVAGPRADLLDTRAGAYLALGQVGPAIADLQEVNLDSPSPSRYLHLARAYQVANNQEAARQTLQRARAAGLEAKRLQPEDLLVYNKMTGDLEQR